MRTVMARIPMRFKVYTVAMVEKTNLILMYLVQCRAAIHDVVVLECAVLVIMSVVVMVYAKKERRWPIVQLMIVNVAMTYVTMVKIPVTAPKTVIVLSMAIAILLKQRLTVLSIVIVGMVYANLFSVKP
jgi:hypothetical protein